MKDKVFLDTNIFICTIDSSPQLSFKRDMARSIILAKAGIQALRGFLDPCFHRGDGKNNLPPCFLDTL
jgi:hypothetical protein